MRQREREPRAGAQHALDLAQDATEVGERGERALGERDVDGVAAEEREVGEVARVQLDPHLGGLGALARREHGPGVGSTAMTVAPRRASSTARVPSPHPSSRTRLRSTSTEQPCEREVLCHGGAP